MATSRSDLWPHPPNPTSYRGVIGRGAEANRAESKAADTQTHKLMLNAQRLDLGTGTYLIPSLSFTKSHHKNPEETYVDFQIRAARSQATACFVSISTPAWLPCAWADRYTHLYRSLFVRTEADGNHSLAACWRTLRLTFLGDAMCQKHIWVDALPFLSELLKWVSQTKPRGNIIGLFFWSSGPLGDKTSASRSRSLGFSAIVSQVANVDYKPCRKKYAHLHYSEKKKNPSYYQTVHVFRGGFLF